MVIVWESNAVGNYVGTDEGRDPYVPNLEDGDGPQPSSIKPLRLRGLVCYESSTMIAALVRIFPVPVDAIQSYLL